MKIEATWITQRGTRTLDNRDHAGIIFHADQFLCVVVDGATNGKANGDYARSITRALIDWFVDTTGIMSAEKIVGTLKGIQGALRESFPSGSASVLIVYIDNIGTVTAINTGDCVLGELSQNGGIVWRTKPHTLANALTDLDVEDIAKSPIRNRLTKSLRSREFQIPDILTFSETPDRLVLATDGFWAELSKDEQSQFMQGHPAEDIEHDDRSVLTLTIRPKEELQLVLKELGENLYRQGRT